MCILLTCNEVRARNESCFRSCFPYAVAVHFALATWAKCREYLENEKTPPGYPASKAGGIWFIYVSGLHVMAQRKRPPATLQPHMWLNRMRYSMALRLNIVSASSSKTGFGRHGSNVRCTARCAASLAVAASHSAAAHRAVTKPTWLGLRESP